MDQIEEEKCVADPLRYPKHHAGLMTIRNIEMPKLLVKNAREILEEHDLIDQASFVQEVVRLQQIYLRRQPPLDKEMYSTKMLALAQKVYEDKLTELKIKPEDMSQEDAMKLNKDLQRKVITAYNKTTHNHYVMEYSGHNKLIYLGARLSPNYRVLLQIFYELQRFDSEFVPTSLLNVGSGVASAVWASNTIWKKAVQENYCVDTCTQMNDLARSLLSIDRGHPLKLAVNGATFREAIPSDKDSNNRFPLVVSAYLLMEMPSVVERLELVELLWRLTDNYLVLVEHGTMAGYKLIQEARDYILQFGKENPSQEGHVFAPCMHDQLCPKMTHLELPCNFTVEYKALLLDVDHGQGSPRREERYSYVVMKKGPRPEQTDLMPRLVGVNKKSGHVVLDMCLPDASYRRFNVSKKNSVHMLRCAKRCKAGDFLPCSIPESFGKGDNSEEALQEHNSSKDDDDSNYTP
ncbi:methyltransferase-like protein 17, mitochondrial isoform X2 [Mya arenaria]|nr:methyltransferase-like protein 17, mitochondrial isoform X2 [Mya arenaria]